MKLYVVRHGDALSKSINPARPLSSDGRRDIEKLAAFLKPRKLAVAEIWHSGKERSRQTAEILSSAVDSQKEIKSIDGLNPEDPVEPIIEEILSLRDDLMIVSHLPFVDKLTCKLLNCNRDNEFITFPTGGIACLGTSFGSWRLIWFLYPELLSDLTL